jgi:ABC-type Na+ efflux pump permease subunit
MEITTSTIITIVVLLLVVAAVIILVVTNYTSQTPTHLANQRMANEIAMANYQAAGGRARDALASSSHQWTARAYLHRGLVDAALVRHPKSVTAALERLEAQADALGVVYTESNKEFPSSSLVQGLKAMDQALLEATQHYAVGDTPSYDASLASAASAHTLVGTDAASLGALSDYQAAMVAYMRAVARGAHALAYVELDKAVVASQALGNALLHPALA